MSETSASDSSKPAAPGLVPVIEFLRRHAPFDRMATEHVEFLARRASLAFYAKDEAVIERGGGPAERFHIIKQGRVRGEARDTQASGEEGAWELGVGECFPIGALLSHRSVYTLHRAVEDTFCYELTRDDFQHLIAESAEFHDFCTRRLANLLDQALARVQARAASQVSGENALGTPLRDLLRRAPVTCAPGLSVRAAAKIMHAEHIGSVVVADADQRPLGVFTLHDLLNRVVDADVDLEAPLEQVMTPEPLALPPGALAYEAAALMAARGIGHLCVVSEGRLVGVLSERDLFALQRIGIVHLARAIRHAPDIATLARLGHDVHRLAEQMFAQGASIAQLTQLITQLNDHTTRRVLTLVAQERGAPDIDYTWLAFGSEGRHEQMLKTDQDNGILFQVPGGASAAGIRERLLPFARRVNEALDEVGFPLCRGNIMASNPACCLSIEEWKQRFDEWIEYGGPEDLLNMSIFFDLRAITGDEALVEELRAHVLARAAATPRFLHQLAANALRNTPPLGLVRDFVVESEGEHANTIDLKLRGATPFVDGARLFALAHRLPETNTPARLRAAARAGVLPTREAEAWCDAYEFVQLRRMRQHQRQARAGRALDNHIDPAQLNDLDRRILKEAFRQARKLQSRIALDYQV